MPSKDIEKRRMYAKRHYEKHKDAVKAKTRLHNIAARKRNRDYINELKSATPCADCNKKYPPYVMQFDHLFDKEAMVSSLVRGAHSIERIQREIDKCDIVCANCHAERTHNILEDYEVEV